MYLHRVKSKGNYYIYLRDYDPSVTYSKDKRILLYSFGREDKAIKLFYKWRNNFNLFPEELKKIGCARYDLEKWIMSLEARAIELIAT